MGQYDLLGKSQVTGSAVAASVTTKSPDAFKTISEVSDELDIPQHVLRFWESKFTQIRPLKRRGGRRYYRPEDVQIIVKVRELLYQQGYTIKGAKKLIDGGNGKVKTAAVGTVPVAASVVPASSVVVPKSVPHARAVEALRELAQASDAVQGEARFQARTLEEVLSQLKEMRDILKTRV